MVTFGDEPLSRRQWLLLSFYVEGGRGSFFEVLEAVSTVALSHPEWDMEERRSLEEWQADARP